ncbi:hypothetical protein EVAR_69010_1 [Eumeta japonica]|uniref:Dr1-associated corepressor n=1 Tax=Eumeta variegata TaxID=151549 RepID=A0A4C1SM80_EUMVA|nr:hypothetical protein EVAR_69010_1 [Eumeta japonica]
MSEQRFDFLRELVRNIPDISVAEEAANYNDEDNQSSPEEQYPDSDTPYDLSMPSTSVRAGRQLFVSSNGQNGGGQHTHSVIRHTGTTSLSQTNVDGPTAKLPRSDTIPVPQQISGHQHHRLKHQPYSLPSHIDSNSKPNTLRTHPQQTAIPAPIVNFDYCTKPIVKIDYSNLPLSGVTTADNAVAAPLSAPANIASMSGNNSAFNFSAEPVISIDLSNIVNSSAAAVPSMATISIGTGFTAAHTTINNALFSITS